jgi:hypothetical protein
MNCFRENWKGTPPLRVFAEEFGRGALPFEKRAPGYSFLNAAE